MKGPCMLSDAMVAILHSSTACSMLSPWPSRPSVRSGACRSREESLSHPWPRLTAQCASSSRHPIMRTSGVSAPSPGHGVISMDCPADCSRVPRSSPLPCFVSLPPPLPCGRVPDLLKDLLRELKVCWGEGTRRAAVAILLAILLAMFPCACAAGNLRELVPLLCHLRVRWPLGPAPPCPL